MHLLLIVYSKVQRASLILIKLLRFNDPKAFQTLLKLCFLTTNALIWFSGLRPISMFTRAPRALAFSLFDTCSVAL